MVLVNFFPFLINGGYQDDLQFLDGCLDGFFRGFFLCRGDGGEQAADEE